MRPNPTRSNPVIFRQFMRGWIVELESVEASYTFISGSGARSAFHPHSRLAVINKRVQMFLDLRDTQDFFNGGEAGADFIPAVSAQRAHAEINRFLSDSGSRRAIEDERPQRFVQNQQFINTHASLVPELAATLATDTMVEFSGFDFVLGKTDAAEVTLFHFLFHFAMQANRANEALSHHGFHGRGDEERLNAHIDQTGERAGSVVGVKRAENQVPGERGTNSDF